KRSIAAGSRPRDRCCWRRLRPQAVHNLPRAPDLISAETSPKTVGQEGGPMTRFATTLVAFTLIALTAMQPVAAQDNTLGGALLGGAAGALIGGVEDRLGARR